MNHNDHRTLANPVSRRRLLKRSAAVGVIATIPTWASNAPSILAQEEPKSGGTLIIAQGTDVATFDAMQLSGLPSFGVVAQVTEQLVRIGPDGELRPRLAESWEQDGANWTLSLRSGVTFHDGTPFNAEAVKDQLERYLEIGPGRQALAAVQQIEVVDDTTIRIVTDGPYAPLINVLSYAPIVTGSPTAVEAAGDDYGSPTSGAVGTGPFSFKSHTPGEEIVLEANAEYWDGVPLLDSVVIRPIAEASSRVIALEAGDVDFIFDLPPRDALRLDEDDRFVVTRQQSERIPYLTMNNTWGPLQNKQVRQAISYAIDRQAIVDSILLGNGKVAESPVPSLAYGYAPVLPYTYDPGRARELLEEAGYSDGFSVVLTYPPGRFQNDTEMVGAIQLYLQDIGINVEIVQLEFAAWQAESRKPQEENTLQMTLQSRGATTLDADKAVSDFTTAAWTPDGLNLAFYQNDEVDRLVKEQRSIVDEAERLEVLQRIQEIIADDAPDVYLYEQVQIFGALAAVRGVEVDPTQVLLPLNQAWLDR